MTAALPPLRVAALVDLAWRPSAGGHVKCWERLAQAATGRPEALDLTVFFSGDAPRTVPLAPNVRFRILPPVFSTARLPFLGRLPDDTDLSPWHPALARALGEGFDLIHTTDAFFAFAHTARAVARRRRLPLVNSIHTDTPSYTRLYTRQTVERLFPAPLTRLLLDRLHADAFAERRALAQLAAYHRACAYVFVSREDERQRALKTLPADRVRVLRRGIDRNRFDPVRRDRAWLEDRFAIPAGRTVVCLAGRVDRGKNVMIVAEAVRLLAERGLPVHLLCAGEGPERPAIQAMLAGHATCPGQLDPDGLARACAAADIFAQPSEIEVFSNAVMEGLASGLPVLVAERGGMGRLVAHGETGLVVPGTPADWADALAGLIADPDRRLAMGRAARRHAETRLPGWNDVLMRDLMPVWRAVASVRHG
ncbi:MAG: glycosyltransferase [Alphaproteobacteria bacterium]